jgi:hypothetical protein
MKFNGRKHTSKQRKYQKGGVDFQEVLKQVAKQFIVYLFEFEAKK